MSRTVINLNDELMKKAMRLTGLKKKVDVINKALEEFVELPPDHIRWVVKWWRQKKALEKGLK